MKYIHKIFLLFLIIGLVSCSDDFLETDSTEFISTDNMADKGPYNPEIFNGTIRGLYTLMYQTGTGGSTADNLRHDDYGQKGYDVYSDLLSGDMALGGYNYGWYQDIAQLSATEDVEDVSNYRPWRYYYRVVRACNTIIDGLGGNDVTPETDEEKWQMGQAKTMRAYAYFHLASFYANDYNMGTEILPLYNTLDQDAQPLSQASEIWGLIKSDLEAAVDLLDGYQREGLQGVNVDVANAWLAYTYTTMGDYSNAIAAVDKVIGKYSVIPIDKVLGGPDIPRNAYSYIDGDGADWIWGMDLTLDQGLDLVSWWGHCDVFTYSYAAVGDPKVADAGLVNSISNNDVRKGWFGPHPWYGIPNCPINKFYDKERSPFSQREITTDYVYMRVEEMHLLKAEAQAFNDDDAAARTTLKAFLNNRMTNTDYIDALSGQDLKDEIYKQWRIEMWGEGRSYFAMKRFKATIVREGHIDLNGIPIPYNDDRLTFMIPQQEIQDNPFIDPQ